MTNTHTPESRFNEEGDWIARRFFSPADLAMSPEEYAARHAHQFGCFSFHLYRYADAALEAWIRRVGEILSTEGETERCRQRFLTPQEIESIRQQEGQDL